MPLVVTCPEAVAVQVGQLLTVAVLVAPLEVIQVYVVNGVVVAVVVTAGRTIPPPKASTVLTFGVGVAATTPEGFELPA
jgi:hypothetical protein